LAPFFLIITVIVSYYQKLFLNCYLLPPPDEPDESDEPKACRKCHHYQQHQHHESHCHKNLRIEGQGHVIWVMHDANGYLQKVKSASFLAT
jgi:hypothetical protein